MKNAKNGKSPVFAVVIWLLIFLALGAIFIARANPELMGSQEWTQSKFEQELQQKNIVSANMMPESDNVYYIEGEYRIPVKPEKKENTLDTRKKSAIGKKSPNLYSARVMMTPAIMQNLSSAKVTVLQKDVWWKSLLIQLVIGAVVIAFIYFLLARQMGRAGHDAMQFGKSRARIIMPDEHRKTFDDVAGCDEAKEETKEIVDYLRDPLKYKLLGGKIPKGALLVGPPGTGKTLMAKAVAGEASVPFFAISGSDFVEMFVGVGASRVRDMFEQARKASPCLIFIDEIDAVGRSRFTGIGGGHDEREQTLNALLVEMDGLTSSEGVILLAATNRVDVLDPALLRPGRFDRQIVIDLPDIAGRRKILDVHAKNVKLDKDVDLDVIARSTPGFSGADLANLMNEAALLAARYEQKAATQNDLEEARDKVCWGRERKSRKISEKERRLTAWHEAGHAILTLFCEHATPLHKVTIIPRGMALGMTMMLPEEDRYSRSRLEMIDEMIVDMGGRVAEELVFGDITGGAAQDINQATSIAHAMVCKFGMSEKLGPVRYGSRSEHIYLGKDITRSQEFSEETAREIDLEVKALVTAAKAKATDILTREKARMDLLAETLLEKETLSAAEVRVLLNLPDPAAGEKISAADSEHKDNVSAVNMQ
ncbi:MAG: ATP-dependent zinc metalloprotease FtsH [Lentisphaeria bacterium]|nr:ATP-dependent zinc metalloprotease FtsH [Lentisphaeria bacterium]